MINQNQKKNRHEYLGGSDMNALMGTSKFKKYDDLVFEKSGIVESDFVGNPFTLFGELMEPKIQKYFEIINADDEEYKKEISGFPIVGHIDGIKEIDGELHLCEIKTSSQGILAVSRHNNPQIQMYMHLIGLNKCVLYSLKRDDEIKEKLKNSSGVFYYSWKNQPESEQLDVLRETITTEFNNFTLTSELFKTKVIEYDPEYFIEMENKIAEFKTDVEYCKSLKMIMEDEDIKKEYYRKKENNE